MKTFPGPVIALGLSVAAMAHGSTPAAANQFLKYVFGGDGVPIETICWPTDDLWMLRGVKNAPALAQLAQEKIPHRLNEIVWANIQNAVCRFEVREGRIDPAFMLDEVYQLHRQLVVQFVYAALTQDRSAMQRLTTSAGNVSFGGMKFPPSGNLDAYDKIIARLPMVRVSAPAADKVSRSISYRVPLGAAGFTLRLVKPGGTWLVETGTRVDVPLDFLVM